MLLRCTPQFTYVAEGASAGSWQEQQQQQQQLLRLVGQFGHCKCQANLVACIFRPSSLPRLLRASYGHVDVARMLLFAEGKQGASCQAFGWQFGI